MDLIKSIAEITHVIFELLGSKCMDTIDKLLHLVVIQPDRFIQSLCKAYYDLEKRDIDLAIRNYYVVMLLIMFNNFFKQSSQSQQYTEKVFGIFDKELKEDKEITHILVLRECLKFFTRLCEIDIRPVYLIREKIIDILSSISSMHIADNKLELDILDLIKLGYYFNFKIFHFFI